MYNPRDDTRYINYPCMVRDTYWRDLARYAIAWTVKTLLPSLAGGIVGGALYQWIAR